MMLMLKFLAVFFISLITQASAVIHKINSFNQASKHLPLIGKNVLTFFDLCNTLIWPKQDGCFSDHGLKVFAQHLANKKNISQPEAFARLLPPYFKFHETVDVRTTEEGVHRFVNFFKECGSITTSITSRSVDIAEPTKRQLSSVNISFSQPFVNASFPLSLENLACYHHGVFHCGKNSKGAIFTHAYQMFKAVLAQEGCDVNTVIFFDDSEYHLLDVQRAAEELGLTFIGFRYACLDEIVAAFDLAKYVLPEC